MQTSEFVVEIKDADPQEVLLLPVGPDQKYYNNKMFSDLLDYVNEHNLNVEMAIADTLRRFTFEMTGQFTKASAEELSQQLGISWKNKNLEGNREAYEALKKSGRIKVTHWDEFKLKHKKLFNNLYEIILSIHKNKDSKFYKTVKEARKNFCTLFEEKNQTNTFFDNQKAKDLSLQYILEECTVMLMWRFVGYKQMAYPISANLTNQKVFNCLKVIAGEIIGNSLYPEISNLTDSGLKQLNLLVRYRNTKNKKNSPLPKNKEESTQQIDSVKDSKQLQSIRQKSFSAPSRLEDSFIKYEENQIMERETRSKSEHSSPRNNSPEKSPRTFGNQSFWSNPNGQYSMIDLQSKKINGALMAIYYVPDKDFQDRCMKNLFDCVIQNQSDNTSVYNNTSSK